MGKVRTLRTCRNGHEFYKSTDCPVCPKCQEMLVSQTSFLSIISAPARRALENNGITTLEQISKYTVKEILNLHGLGESTIPKLQKLLHENELSFKE